jgi:hypothetical protein
MLIAASVVCAVGIAAIFAFARRVDPHTGSLKLKKGLLAPGRRQAKAQRALRG